MVDFINKIIWQILSKPYFDVMIISNGRKIKRFIQLAASKDTGADSFLICKSLKMTWWKPYTPIVDGISFLTFVDLNNAIPLLIEEDIITEDKGLYIKEKKEITIKEDVEKQKKNTKNGNTLKTVEVSIIPRLLHEIVEAHLVGQIMSSPKDEKYESIKTIFIVGIIVVGIVLLALIIMGKI